MTAMHLWHVCTVARWLTCSASAFAASLTRDSSPVRFHGDRVAPRRRIVRTDRNALPHEWPRPRKGGAVEIGRTCETACRSEEDCPKGKSCLMIDHGPRSSTGSLCLKSTFP